MTGVILIIYAVLFTAAATAFLGWLVMLALGILGVSVGFFVVWPLTALTTLIIRLAAAMVKR